MPSFQTGSVAVTVPAVTDPDIGSVDVTLTTAQGVVNVGDNVVVTPLEDLSATTRLLSAYVISPQVIRVVVGSLGGNIVSADKNMKFHIIYA